MLQCLLLEPTLVDHVALETKDFYIDRHKFIYQVISDLHNVGKPIDYTLICGELDKRKILGEVGGPAFITSLLTGDAWTYNAKGYADELREKTRRRNLVQVANKLANAIYDSSSRLDDVLPDIINAIINTSSITDGAQHIKVYLSKLLDEVEERSKNPVDIWGIPTGFPTFDKLTGGIQHGELFALAGEPGVGKSLLAMQMVIQMAKKEPGAIYSLEMDGVNVMRRLTSWKSKVATRSMNTGRVEDSDWPAIINAIEELESLPVYMSDGTGWTTTQIRADLARLKAQAGVKWFLLDYSYLLNDGNGLKETEKTTIISAALKQICRGLDISGIAINSITKEGMGKADGNNAPNKSNLRGSGQQVHDADLIVFLTNYKPVDGLLIPDKDRKNVRLLWFEKGRNLEESSKVIPFVKLPGFPGFGEYQFPPFGGR
jgi:replicative DNA helicase